LGLNFVSPQKAGLFRHQPQRNRGDECAISHDYGMLHFI